MGFVLEMGMFLIFLLSFAVWLYLGKKLSDSMKKAMLEGRDFWVAEAGFLLGIAAFFLFNFILSGFFDFYMVLLFFVAFQIGIVISYVLWGFLGPPSSNCNACLFWAGFEFTAKNPLLMAIMLIVPAIIILIVFPTLCGISYFSDSLGFHERTIQILQYTLVGVVFSGFPIMLMISVGVIVEKNLDEDSRTKQFVRQLAGLPPLALYIAVAFWAFGIGESEQSITFGGIGVAVSPLLVIILIGFFLLSLVFPYLIGVQRGKKWRIKLNEEQRSYLRNLEEILVSPNVSQTICKLESFRENFDQNRQDYLDNDLVFGWADMLESEVELGPLSELISVYPEVKKGDSRFKYREWLHKLHQQIEEMCVNLKECESDEQIKNNSTGWAKIIKSQRECLKNIYEEEKSSKPVIWAGVGSVFATIASVILGALGNLVYALFQQGGPMS